MLQLQPELTCMRTMTATTAAGMTWVASMASMCDWMMTGGMSGVMARVVALVALVVSQMMMPRVVAAEEKVKAT